MRRGAVLAACAAALAAVLLLFANSRPGLRVQYALQAALMRHAAVTTLDLEPAGRIPMFLNASDTVVTPRIMAGLFEVVESQYVLQGLRPGDTFVDVGANVGYYTLLAANLVGEAGRVFAFEPDPESFALLERNVRLNRFENVVLEQKAVSNQPGTLRLYLAPVNKGDHRIYPTGTEERSSVEIEAVTLDGYFADDPGAIDFVKIDTQGAELAILEGMTGILEANPDMLLSVEFWPYGLREFGDDARELLDFLVLRDFRFIDGRAGEVGSEWLLRTYDMVEYKYTNLLLLKGRGELERLRAAVRRWQQKVAEDDSEASRRELEQAVTALRARLPSAPGFPRAPR